MRKTFFLTCMLAALGSVASFGAQPKIGLSFSDFATERWARERDEMTQILKKAGYEVLVKRPTTTPSCRTTR